MYVFFLCFYVFVMFFDVFDAFVMFFDVFFDVFVMLFFFLMLLYFFNVFKVFVMFFNVVDAFVMFVWCFWCLFDMFVWFCWCLLMFLLMYFWFFCIQQVKSWRDRKGLIRRRLLAQLVFSYIFTDFDFCKKHDVLQLWNGLWILLDGPAPTGSTERSQIKLQKLCCSSVCPYVLQCFFVEDFWDCNSMLGPI